MDHLPGLSLSSKIFCRLRPYCAWGNKNYGIFKQGGVQVRVRNFLSLVLMVSCFSLAAQEKVFLSYCSSSFGDGVPFSFQSCVNRNFSEIGRNVDRAYFSYCYNAGERVSFSFVSCLQNNFREAEREIGDLLYLSYCSNFSDDRLDWSFINCVNGNFRSIERALSNLSL